MAKQKRTAKSSNPNKKRLAKAKPPVVDKQSSSSADFARLPEGPTGAAGEGIIQAQAARLGDIRMKSSQKWDLATRIGRTYGNQHLQRVMGTLNKPQASGTEDGPQIFRSVDSEKPERQRQAAFGRADVMGKTEGEARWMPVLVQRQKGGGVGPDGTKGGAGPSAKKGGPAAVTFSKMSFNPKEIPADGKTTSQALVKTTPAGRALQWGFIGADYGSSVSGSGLITPGNDTKKNEQVDLQVKATDDQVPTAFTSGVLPLWDAKYYQAKKDYPKFVAGSYQLPNFTIGLNGKFDAKYQPAAKKLDISVRVKFDFVNDKSGAFDRFVHAMLGVFSDNAADGYAASHGMWTTKAMANYRKTFMSQVTTAWNKSYQFQNEREPKKIWNKLGPVGVKVNVTEVPEGASNQHFTVRVHKKAGGAQVAGGITDLYPGDETTQSPFFQKGATQGELNRLAKVNPGPILFQNNSTEVDPADAKKLDFMKTYLSRINIPKFDINISGHANTVGDKTPRGQARNQDLARDRAQTVADLLQGTGHTTKTTSAGTAGATDDPLWRKADITPAIQAGFVNKFDTIPHEFGHMIGLGDEYKRPGAAKLTTHHALVVKAFGQKYADLVAKRGSAPTTQGTSSSIMNVGQDVRIYHYVTFWSALCETTLKQASVPDPKFGYNDWKFIG